MNNLTTSQLYSLFYANYETHLIYSDDEARLNGADILTGICYPDTRNFTPVPHTITRDRLLSTYSSLPWSWEKIL